VRSEGTTGLLIVSHSQQLAAGIVELAGQMAPGTPLAGIGGMPDGSLGTSYDRVREATQELLRRTGGIVALADVGSAAMIAEMVAEELTTAERPVALVAAPIVEGAVAAAVAAHGGGTVAEVAAAARSAQAAFLTHLPEAEPGAGATDDPVIARDVVLHNVLGLHARPAAMVARMAGSYDARLEVNGVDATSVLALMSLGLVRGDTVELRAFGRDAERALDAVTAVISDGFGEE